MYCHKCGNQISEEAAFCPTCGTKTARPKVSSQSSSAPIASNQGTPKSVQSLGKVKWLVGLVVIVCVVIVAVNLTRDRSDDDNSNYPSYSASAQQSGASESSFAWVEEAEMITEDDFITSRYIVGSIENISDVTFLSASVEFALYDSSGNQVDTTYDVIKNFKSGNTWRFKASVLSSDVAYFEFIQATKTY